MVLAGQEQARFPGTEQAALAGVVVPSQAQAITSVLADLPKELDTAQVVQAESLMVGFARSHHAAELRRLGAPLLEVVAPDTADELEATRLERAECRARANRRFEFIHDGHGQIHLRGVLPAAAAEPFIRIIDSYAAAEKRALDALDPHAAPVSPAMRRADALLAMVHHHAQAALAPTHAGDRPRAVITVSWDKLQQHCLDAGLAVPGPTGAAILTNGEPLTPATARQLLCDADILPVVMSGPSQILDVGRTQRLITPPIRAALELRDQGCVFPGCDKPPQGCHAHHLHPWWAGGTTTINNLVLVCPHHHNIVEPSRNPAAQPFRWNARIAGDGVPEVLPPRHVDPTQRPRRHARFLTR